jgi:hypothetical protein
MTAKRGTQWKTSWRRQKPSLGTAPQGMWWFANFGDGLGGESFFEQPATTPSIGDLAPPFWIGSIYGSSVPGAALNTQVARGVGAPLPTTPSWLSGLFWDTSELRAFVKSRASAFPFFPETEQVLAPLGAMASPALIRGVVQMLVVESILLPAPDFASLRLTLWVDGALRGTAISPGGTYIPSLGNLFVQPKLGFLNSMAGGNALPTTQEIQDWFANSRYALPFPSAQPIPGKTLDQYDAALVPGVVPAALTNLSGGQAAPLLSVGVPPVPVNLFLPTTFGF